MKLGKKIFLMSLSVGLILIMVLGVYSIANLIYLKWSLNNAQSQSSENISERSRANSSAAVNKHAQYIYNDQSNQINNKFFKIYNEIDVISSYLSDLYNKNSYTNNDYVDDDVLLQPGVSKIDVYDEYNKIKNIKTLMLGFVESRDDDRQRSILYVSESGMKISASSIIKTQESNILNNIDMRKMNWYTGAVEKGGFYWSEVYADSETGKSILTCSFPIYDNLGNLKGVLAENVVVDNFYSNTKETDEKAIKYYFLLDQNNKFILGCRANEVPTDYINNEFYNQILNTINSSSDKKGIIMVDDSIAGYSSIQNNGWNLVAIFDYDTLANSYKDVEVRSENFWNKVLDGIEKKIFITSIVYIGILALSTLFVVMISKKFLNKIERPVEDIKGVVREIGKGNLDQKIQINELDDLSSEFNRMTVDLKDYMNNLEKIIAERKRISTELEVAKTIQTSMLLTDFSEFPSISGIDLYATSKPAKEVGGDFYDFFMLDKNRMVFIIADASGKGVPAALFMVIAKTLIKNQAQLGLSPKDILKSVNESLCENNKANMFVTAIVGIFDFKLEKITFANAGHNLPLIYKNGKGFEWLKLKPNFILAGMKNVNYINQTIEIKKGDKIFLYTDGVTEALNNDKELFSNDRLINCLNDGFVKNSTHAKDILDHVQSSVNKFTQGAEQADDITMLVIDYEEDGPNIYN